MVGGDEQTRRHARALKIGALAHGMDAIFWKPLDNSALGGTTALRVGRRLIQPALRDEVQRKDHDKESNNDAGRSQGHRIPSG
jgi:hypothetical protein